MERDFKVIKEWYSDLGVLYEMIKSLKGRELALIVPKWASEEERKRTNRMNRAHSVQNLTGVFNCIRWFQDETPYNLYYSIASYKSGVPYKDFKDPKKNESWKTQHHNNMTGYDFFLDIDSPSHAFLPMAYDDAFQIKKLFDYEGVPYELRFSGCGFHFIIPAKYWAKMDLDPRRLPNIYTVFKQIASKLSEEFTEFIDTGIYDSRRVCKLPYSLALYEDTTPLVCYPFVDDDDFKNFDFRDMRCTNLKGKLKGRGLHIFNEYGKVDGLIRWCGW